MRIHFLNLLMKSFYPQLLENSFFGIVSRVSLVALKELTCE